MPLDIQVHDSGPNVQVRWARLNAGEVYESGQLVGVNDDGELVEFPDDGTEALDADIDVEGALGGVSAEWAIDRALLPGATTSRGVDTTVGYYPWNTGMLFRTDNFWAAGGASAVVPQLTDVGEIYKMTFDNTLTNTWGIEQEAAVLGTDIAAVVHGVLDSLGRPVLAGNTTAGVSVIFEIRRAT